MAYSHKAVCECLKYEVSLDNKKIRIMDVGGICLAVQWYQDQHKCFILIAESSCTPHEQVQGKKNEKRGTIHDNFIRKGKPSPETPSRLLLNSYYKGLCHQAIPRCQEKLENQPFNFSRLFRRHGKGRRLGVGVELVSLQWVCQYRTGEVNKWMVGVILWVDIKRSQIQFWIPRFSYIIHSGRPF